jgi:LysR family transcriptional regulator, glycine cleavage system transcriptional activator
MKSRELPLSALRAFATAAQWTNQVRAAEELGVTHGAISRQIGKLEQWIGQDLFYRQGRQLVLTPTGEFLAAKIGHSLTEMMSACLDIAGTGKQHIVTIEAPTTFAMYWLLPRLKDFESRVPDTEISLATRMTNQSYDGPLGDIVITRERGLDRRLQSFDKFVLMDEDMRLLAAPSFLESANILKARDVLHHQMVSTVTRPTDWPNWLSNAGLRGEHVRFRHLFDHLFVALNCARDGLGTIVAPRNIFENEAGSAIFRPILPQIGFKGQSYYVYYRSAGRTGAIAKIVELLRGCRSRSDS